MIHQEISGIPVERVGLLIRTMKLQDWKVSKSYLKEKIRKSEKESQREGEWERREMMRGKGGLDHVTSSGPDDTSASVPYRGAKKDRKK